MKTRIPLSLLLGAACLSSAVAPAEEEATNLPTLEVTGTRLREEPLEQPYAFYRHSKADLDQRIGRTALDRINYGPGVFVQRTAPNQASPYIRGLTGERTLLMIDGVRLSHAMMRPGPNQYSALVSGMSVSAIDVILGPSSVVNGSDGLTGALDYRLAEAGRGVEAAASPWISSRVDSGNGGTLRGGVDGADGDWAYSVELSGSSFHDRVGGEDFRDHVFGPGKAAYDEIPNTAYDEAAAALRLAYLGIRDHRLELNAGYTRQTDAPRPDGYFQNTGESDRISRYFDPQEFGYIHLRDSWRIGSPVVERLRTTLWWHRHAEEQFRENLTDEGTRYRRRELDNALDAFGVDTQATTLWGDGAHELIWGGTFLYETTDNAYREFRTPAGIVDPAAAMPFRPGRWEENTILTDGSDYTTLGLFAQDNWLPTERFRLLTGLRYSRMDWSFGGVEGDADNLSGGLRGLLDVMEHQNVFAGLSRGFRAPNLTNLDGQVDRGSSGEFARGNADLDPEISYTAEAGWRWFEGRDSLRVTLFHTTIEDLIQRDFSGDGEFTNVEEAGIQGAEAAWDLGLGPLFGDDPNRRVALVGSVSLVDATRDIPLEGGGAVEDNLSRANRLYGRAGLKVERWANWWGLAQVRWHDDYDEVATHPASPDSGDIRLTVAGDPDGGLPGYAVADLMVGWKSGDGRRELAFYVENLADETYREPGSGVDGVGRSVGMTAKIRF